MLTTSFCCVDCRCPVREARVADSLCYACLHRRYLASKAEAASNSRLLTQTERSLAAALDQIRAFLYTPRSETNHGQDQIQMP